ncbi:MAG: lectin-like protein [Planctomycetota bacterium]
MNGEPFGFTNWASGEPNNGGSSAPAEEVIQMYNSGLWNDVFGTVTDTFGYVVEFDQESTPALNPANGHFYRTIDVALTWEEAREAASSLSFRGAEGHLATVTSESERAFITSIYPAGTNRWLGGYQDTLAADYSEPAGGWRWVTGEPMIYENWQSGEPNNGSATSALEEHLHSYSSGRWNDTFINAGDILGYVVEFDGALGDVACSSNANSTGLPGTIQADGSRDVQDNDVALVASSLPLGSFGFFITSDTPASLSLPGLSEGILCLGGSIGRYVGPGQIQNSGSTGAFELQIDLGNVPTPVGPVSVSRGETRFFQAWYRDSIGGSPTSNFTNGMSISFR